MTREEIDSRAFWADIKVDDYPVVYLSDAIKIIDDLESRTCGNCKWYTYLKSDGVSVCDNADNMQEYLGDFRMQITEDFGCNKWKAKDDS